MLAGSPLDALLLTLLEATVGGLAALLLTEWCGEVTSGFLRLGGLLVLLLAVLTLLAPGARPGPVGPLVVLFALAALAYFVLLLTTATLPRRLVALVAIGAGGAALAGLALRLPSTELPGLPLVEVLADTLVLGGAGVGLALGHWYLVTPRLSARPLRRLVDVLLVGLALEALVLLGPIAVGRGTLADFAQIGRVAAALVLPTVVALAARSCCREWPRGRALQAATGLLYVATASAFAGILLGNLLRFAPAASL